MVFVWAAFGVLVLLVFKEPPRRATEGMALDFLAHHDRFEESSNENDTEEDDLEMYDSDFPQSPQSKGPTSESVSW